MTQTVYLNDEPYVVDIYFWWDENDGEEAGIIYGLAGRDFVEGDAGDDYLDGGDGNDHLMGGKYPIGSVEAYEAFKHQYWGNDVLVGGLNDDSLYGGSGTDSLYGNSGVDELSGGDGNDFLYGGSEADVISGGDGLDMASYLYSPSGLTVDFRYPWLSTGEAAGDTYDFVEGIIGSGFADNLRGDQWANRIEGAGGQDYIYGFEGGDVLLGDTGDDILNGGLHADALFGGTGDDWASYIHSAGGLIVDLMNPGLNTGEAIDDTYNSIENLLGSEYDDHLGGDQFANLIQGYYGNDVLVGHDGSDILYGEWGNDTLIGEQGHDWLDGGPGQDYASYFSSPVGLTADMKFPNLNTGHAADDSYISIENLQGSQFSDVLGGDDLPNIIGALSGNDQVSGYGGDDFLYGEDGHDWILGGAGNDTLVGGNDNDTLDGGSDSTGDLLDGQSGNDTASYLSSPIGLTADMLYYAGFNSGDARYDLYVSIEDLQGSQFGDHLGGDNSNNVIYGMNGDDFLAGRIGNDVLEGGIGNDVLYGEAGIDGLYGGDGSDTASYLTAPTGVVFDFLSPGLNTGDAAGDYWDSIENVEGSQYGDQLYGDDSSNSIKGLDGVDLLVGRGGGDSLDGGLGADQMSGGLGSDTYIVDNSFDVISENVGEGTDTVYASTTFVLPANVEDLVLLGVGGSIAGYGNALANIIAGTIAGDVIDGMAGADTMIGGAGNDSYFADTSFDQAIENPGEGTDTVYAGANFQLGVEVENLILTGGDNLNGFGNNQVNSIIGNSGNNVLDGGLGADNLTGGIGNDNYVVDNPFEVISENPGEGTDAVFANASFQLGANLETLLLQGGGNLNGAGNDLVNTLIGTAGDNVLNGEVGADTMIGGVGTDVYYVDNNFETITENPGEGVDTVYASISYQVGNNLEFLYLQGTAGINGFGNPVTNYIEGNSGDNGIDGGGGTDALWGKAGNDLFIFHAGEANGDILYDFAGNGAGIGDWMQFVGFGTAGGGATFTQVGATNQWQIHSGLDAHNEFITFDNGAGVDPNDFIFA